MAGMTTGMEERSEVWPGPANPPSDGPLTFEELQLAGRNRGMPLEALRYDITPTGLHYLLVHFDIPAVDAATWRLQLDGLVDQPLELSLTDLRSRPRQTVPVTLECAGNGRARLQRLAIHLVDEEDLGPPSIGDGQAALVVVLDAALHAAILAGEDELDRLGTQAGLVEQGPERRAGPLRRADGLEEPRVAERPGLQSRPAIAGALERDRHGPPWS